jgi:MerR family transcriptional regulator, aldehyde-responsive regulator
MSFTIQEAAMRAGVSAYTIRFYEKQGVLPPVSRASSGIRRFSDSDMLFLHFVLDLKKTGMSLEEVAEFTEDGCILESLERGERVHKPAGRRIAILRKHEQRLHAQQENIERMLSAVDQKITFYKQFVSEEE